MLLLPYMKLIEVFKMGKRADPALCEDGYVITPHFAAVVDGSTSKVAGRSGGRTAMLTVCKALQSLPADATKEEMLGYLSQALAQKNIPRARTEAQYRLTCVAAIFSLMRRVVWLVGDCQCRFDAQTHTNTKLIDHELSQVRADIVHYLLRHGHNVEDLRQNDLGRSFILDALRAQTNFQNLHDATNPYAYVVLDGTPIDASRVPEIEVPLQTEECILATDGYPTLCDTLADTETALHTMLTADPLCINLNVGTKGWMAGNLSYDDRCYLRIALH